MPIRTMFGPASDVAGQRTVLVAEDNRPLRELISVALREDGFVLLAADAVDEALAIVKNYGGPVDLAIIDMNLSSPRLPCVSGTSGLDLAVELERIQAGIKTLYITGHPSAMAIQAIQHQSPAQVLLKPFAVPELVERVRSLLAPAVDATQRACPGLHGFSKRRSNRDR